MPADGVEGNGRLGRCQQGILPFFRFGPGVAGSAGEHGIHLVRSQEALGHADQGTVVIIAQADVPADEVIHIVYDAAPDHAFGPDHSFFSWLEADFQGTCHPVFVGCCQPGHCQTDGGMAVMAAGMHQPRMLGLESKGAGPMAGSRIFRHEQGIDVEAQGHGFPRFGEMHDPHTAGHAPFHPVHQHRVGPFFDGPLGALFQSLFIGHHHPGSFIQDVAAHEDFIPQLLEFLCNEGSGPEFRPGSFRMGMEIPPLPDHLVLHLHGFFVIGHTFILPACIL